MLASAFEALYKTCMTMIERDLFPDFLIRIGIRTLLKKRLAQTLKGGLDDQQARKMEFVEELRTLPIAVQTQAANDQHYEVPTEYFLLCLGKWMKYSSCFYKLESDDLDTAEENMMSLYCTRAKLENGQKMLDVGCGWGSLTLFLASAYPKSQVTGVSNSSTQKKYIESKAEELGLKNVKVITCDMNEFEAPEKYDRILSIEMFEHMKNYQELLRKVSTWLEPNGLLFLHYFCHKHAPYHFKDEGADDWMSRYFFSGGTMPSLDLMLYFQDHLKVKDIKYVNGSHYSKTLEAWLKEMDQRTDKVMPIFRDTYGEKDADKWRIYWRLFYLACSELFNYNGGNEWGVAHVLFEKR